MYVYGGYYSASSEDATVKIRGAYFKPPTSCGLVYGHILNLLKLILSPSVNNDVRTSHVNSNYIPATKHKTCTSNVLVSLLHIEFPATRTTQPKYESHLTRLTTSMSDTIFELLLMALAISMLSFRCLPVEPSNQKCQLERLLLIQPRITESSIIET